VQTEAGRLGWDCALHGTPGKVVHLLIRIPHPTAGAKKQLQLRRSRQQEGTVEAAAHTFLEVALARVFSRAGLGSWRLPTGCADPAIPLKIQRYVECICFCGLEVVAGRQTWRCCVYIPSSPVASACSVADFSGFASSVPDGAAGCIRLLPASAGSFDEILRALRGDAPVSLPRGVSATGVKGQETASPNPAEVTGGSGNDDGGATGIPVRHSHARVR
jgi:hypothetical protein